MSFSPPAGAHEDQLLLPPPPPPPPGLRGVIAVSPPVPLAPSPLAEGLRVSCRQAYVTGQRMAAAPADPGQKRRTASRALLSRYDAALATI